VVKHCLAAFDLVFLLNPSFESIFAQKQSCRPSIPLQLLFWPNFMFPYEVWSFGWSNFAQNHFKRIQLVYCALDAVRARRRQQHRRRHASDVGEPRLPCSRVVLISPGAMSVFLPLLLPHARGLRRARTEPSPAAVLTTLAAPLRLLAPQADLPRPEALPPLLELD